MKENKADTNGEAIEIKEKELKIKIKKAKKSDFVRIVELIRELAEFERLDPPDQKAVKRLYKDAFGKKPFIKMLIAKQEKEIVGYAIYFDAYSSFLGKKTMFLEDIFVTQTLRNTGIGKLFFEELIKIAKKDKFGRVEWSVLDWNINAIAFYNKIGAKPLSEWVYYRLTL
ncbi:MAG: GNAT family N-acetyltransferase [Ignavibacteria bacterium]|nr:GNAT family N-acetyltransferase [Ignavibacteria bacterium]